MADPAETPASRLIRVGSFASFFCAAGVYLWAAIAAPPVVWSDSRVDLVWAKQGLGTHVAPEDQSTADVHPVKPGYIAFLRLGLALRFLPDENRNIVLLQSILLIVSIWFVTRYLARRFGAGWALAVGATLFAFLRLRDAASAIMSEAIAAALLLPMAAVLIRPPGKGQRKAAVAVGVTAGTLILVRPNVGIPLAVLVLVRWSLCGLRKQSLVFVASAALAAVAIIVTVSPWRRQEPLHTVSSVALVGSADYYWAPSLKSVAPSLDDRGRPATALQRMLSNWKRTLSRFDADAIRQLVWRGFRGISGSDYYDATWSPPYHALDEASRILSPFLIFAAVAALLTFPFGGDDRSLNVLGFLFLAFLILHNLVFGSLPRYILPFLPALLLLGVAALRELLRQRTRRLVFVGAFVGLLGLAATNRHILDWEWGRIEAAGVRIRQPIARGALPPAGPATLHIRIAEPFLPTAARIEVVGPREQILFDSAATADLSRPAITINLPDSLIAENRESAVFVEVRSSGSFDSEHFFLFPVIPPPWSTQAERVGSNVLSPSTGLRCGALDWWSHAGTDPELAAGR